MIGNKNIVTNIYGIQEYNSVMCGPGRFPGIAGHAGNHENEGKFHKSHQILNKLCLGKISRYKTIRIKLSVDSRFSNKLYDRKRKHGNAGNQHKAF